MAPAANLKNVVRNIGLVVASTFLSFLVAEWSVRTFYPQQLAVWYTTEDGIVIHPPGLTTYLTEFKQEIRFNALGMRDRDHAKAKPANTTRILVFGDSFMEALQIAFEDSFPSLLESGLRQRLQRNVEVINCAVSGWGQADQLAYLRKYGKALEPDLILVVMTLHNDVFDNMEEKFFTLVNGKLITKPVVRRSSAEWMILRIKGFFASRSHLWQLLRKWKHLGKTRNAATALDKHVMQLISGNEETAELKRGWSLTFELFKAIQAVGKSLGAQTAIMLIPLKLQLQDDSFDDFIRSAGILKNNVIIEKSQRKMQAFGQDVNIQIIDLLPSFREWTVRQRTRETKPSLHLNEGHWNEKGHRLAAHIAIQEIVERQLAEVNSPVVSLSPSVQQPSGDGPHVAPSPDR